MIKNRRGLASPAVHHHHHPPASKIMKRHRPISGRVIYFDDTGLSFHLIVMGLLGSPPSSSNLSPNSPRNFLDKYHLAVAGSYFRASTTVFNANKTGISLSRRFDSRNTGCFFWYS